MADVNGLEKQLNDVFGKQAPKMPKGLYDFLVQYAPILTLVGAVLTAWGALALWQLAHSADTVVKWANDFSRAYGGKAVATSDMTLWVWLAVGFSIVTAIIYFMAYSPLKEKAKRGWDLLFYASLVNIVYSVVMLFIDGRGPGSFIGGLIGTAIGWWILFQIRPAYLAKKAPEHKA